MIIYTVKFDFSHIYMDRYDMSGEEKEQVGRDLISQATWEMFGDDMIVYPEGDSLVFMPNRDGDDWMYENKMKEMTRLLAREFALFVDEESVDEGGGEEDELELFIRQNYLYETLTPTSAAAKFGKTLSEADEEFRRRYGVDVKGYIMTVRVEKAERLLMEGVDRRECALLCGFGSERTMKRAFKAVRGDLIGLNGSGGDFFEK